jgi:putative transposase
MTAWLRTQGHLINRKRVQRLMRLIGLETTTNARAPPRHPNIASIHTCCGGWSSNESTMCGRPILPNIPMARLSLHGRGDGLGEPLRAAGLALFKSARCKFLYRGAGGSVKPGTARDLFNTDQGSQFTDNDFTNVQRPLGVAISMDGRDRFSSNIFVDRLWRSLKYEEIYLRIYQNVAEARHSIAAYFDVLNCELVHQALDYRAPRQFFDEALGIANSGAGRKAASASTQA